MADKILTESQVNNLAELAYSKWCGFYSRHAWFSNYPLYVQLSDKEKTFWKSFVIGIRNGFKDDLEEKKEE